MWFFFSQKLMITYEIFVSCIILIKIKYQFWLTLCILKLKIHVFLWNFEAGHGVAYQNRHHFLGWILITTYLWLHTENILNVSWILNEIHLFKGWYNCLNCVYQFSQNWHNFKLFLVLRINSWYFIITVLRTFFDNICYIFWYKFNHLISKWC